MEKSSRNTYKVFAPIISYNSIKVDEQIKLNEITRMTFIPLERTRLVIGEQPEGEINEKLQKLPRRDYHILNWIWYTRPSLNLRWDGQGRFMGEWINFNQRSSRAMLSSIAVKSYDRSTPDDIAPQWIS